MSRKRREFTDSFRAEVVALCLAGDRSVGQVCQNLDLTESAVRRWMERAKASGNGKPPGALAPNERDELLRLRKENARLRMEREILKKAAAFFASENA